MMISPGDGLVEVLSLYRRVTLATLFGFVLKEHLVASIERRMKQTQNGPNPTAPKFVMQELYEQHGVTWDGSLPDGGMVGLLQSAFVPIECQSGDLVCFCGELDHLSLENDSDDARHTFQLHLVEGPSENVLWDARNWLQYPDGRPFLRLRAEEGEFR